MGIFKTLSLVFISVLVCFQSTSSSAAELYVGGGASFSGVISESDYYNGASTLLPSLNVGVKYGPLALDGFMRKGTLTNEHEGFDIELDTTQIGLMFRFALQEWMDLSLGVHWTSMEGSSSIYAGQQLTGLIDVSYASAVMGMGFNIPFTERLSIRADFNYYLGKQKVSLFQFDISAAYTVLTF